VDIDLATANPKPSEGPESDRSAGGRSSVQMLITCPGPHSQPATWQALIALSQILALRKVNKAS